VGRHRTIRNAFAAPTVVVLVALAVSSGYVYADELTSLLRPEARQAIGGDGPSPPGDVPLDPGPPHRPTLIPEPKGRLVVHGTGDVSMDPGYIPELAANGFGYAWSGLGGLFRRDDLTVINLECAISTGGTPFPKQFTFRGPPEALGPMKTAGIDVANLGNNHAFDYGPDALIDSVRHLRAAQIAPVGAGKDEDRAVAPALFELAGWRVAVVGLNMVVDPVGSVATQDQPGTAAGHDTGLMLKAIRAANHQADIVIVTIHWGKELDTVPRPEQVELGHRFVDAGADVIFGHHSHRLQPMDVYKGKPIFWGLGNFVWPNLSVEGSTTAVARVVVRPGGALEGRLLPAFIGSAGHPVLTG
jgi:poly-gamma-glutamate capsule biosynthesis protein CapA/YwtB (metallophosphatase superfamily)